MDLSPEHEIWRRLGPEHGVERIFRTERAERAFYVLGATNGIYWASAGVSGGESVLAFVPDNGQRRELSLQPGVEQLLASGAPGLLFQADATVMVWPTDGEPETLLDGVISVAAAPFAGEFLLVTRTDGASRVLRVGLRSVTELWVRARTRPRPPRLPRLRSFETTATRRSATPRL